MRYSPETISQLLDRVDMLDLVRNYVDGLENRAGRWWACCPFHNEKTPSFTINLDRKSFYCFGCQEKGNAINLVMKLDSLSFPEALRKLAQRSGFALPERAETAAEAEARQAGRKKLEALYSLYAQVHKSFRQNLRSECGQSARNYLERRGVSPEMAEQFELGYALEDSKAIYHWLRRQNYSAEILRESGLFSTRNEEACLFWQRLMFPVFDHEGRVLAFSGRQLATEIPHSVPKYINSRESAAYRKSESLFGLFQSLKTLRRTRSLILCEGNLDVLAWHQAGIGNAAAPLGTAFTAGQAKLLKRYACDRVILAFDGDAAGQKAIYKAAFLLEQEQISTQVIPLAPGRDPADILQREGGADLRSLAQSPLDFFSFLAQDLEQRFALDELTGVSAALRFLAPFMSQMREGLRRELYIAQFAKIFGLKQEVLAADEAWRYRPQKLNHAKSEVAIKDGKTKIKNEAERKNSPSEAGDVPSGRQPRQRWKTGAAGGALSAEQQSLQAELEFWASLLLQADLYPEWQRKLAESQWDWVSEEALLIKQLLDQACTEQDFNFETLCDRVSRRAPELGEWLLQKKLEPLLYGNVEDPEGYELASYRRAILQHKFCGLQEFRLRQRRQNLVRHIQALEREGSRPGLQFELLGEMQGLDRQLLQLREAMQKLQREIQRSSRSGQMPKL